MFSYRHAYHAGNHADVLKHLTLLSMLRHLQQKDTGLMLIDTHAGVGLYRLDAEQALTSGEAAEGLGLVLEAAAERPDTVPERVQDYLDLIESFNPGAQVMRHYPGSPWIAQSQMRDQDALRLFEANALDARQLERNVEELGKGKQIQVLRKDSFTNLKSLLPPPTRRALTLIDPSYELKTDYASVQSMVADALVRFATGTYAIWYPVIGRPEAHSLPKKLKSIAQQAGKSWLHATLNVGAAAPTSTAEAQRGKTSLRASGMFVINPPYTLKADLDAALPWLVKAMGQGRGQGFELESGG